MDSSLGGHHGNRMRCIVYFSSNTCISHAICLKSIGKSNAPESSAATMGTKLKQSSFQETSGIFR